MAINHEKDHKGQRRIVVSKYWPDGSRVSAVHFHYDGGQEDHGQDRRIDSDGDLACTKNRAFQRHPGEITVKGLLRPTWLTTVRLTIETWPSKETRSNPSCGFWGRSN